MAEKPTSHPTNQYASLEPAKKRPHVDTDFQEAIKKAKREWQRENAGSALAAVGVPKSLSSPGIPGLGYLAREGHAINSGGTEIRREGELHRTNIEQQEICPELERRNSSVGPGTTEISAGFTGRETESRPSIPGAGNGAKNGSHRPFAPPKKPTRKWRRPVDGKVETIETRTTTNPASFYANIDTKAKFNRSDLFTVANINSLISRCQKTAERYGKADPRDFASIRKRLHQMEFYDFLIPIMVKKSKVLDDDTGLPQIFDDPKNICFPWDIKVDALSLHLRWLTGVLDPHLLRGVETERKGTTTKHTGHKLSKDYLGTVSCNVWGENNLQNGQWWPLQICAKRDGAHGEIEGGIHGQAEKGAFSVVLSNGGYDDRDEGDRILYCGTSGSWGEPSAGTSRLLETYRSYQSGSPHPVRVIRTAKLPKDNPYRPSKGLRYDGLYDVIGYDILDVDSAMHRFELKRRGGQDPIRYAGVEVRPTDEEIAEFVKIRGLLGMA